MPTTSLHVSSRAPHLAAVFALVVGSAIVWFAQGSDAAMPGAETVTAAPGPIAMPSVPVESAVAAAAPSAMPLPVAAATEPMAHAADAAPVEADPLSTVIVEPVDPAEALFGDRAQVAVSN